MAEQDQGNAPNPRLEAAAARYLVALTGVPEPLRGLYLQPDRAVYLAERSRIVLKAYDHAPLLAHEHDMTLAARRAGVPVPEVLGFSPGDPAILATRFVQGQPLAPAHPAAAREAGALLARFHRLGAQPPFASGQPRWADHILWWAEYELASLERRGIFDANRLDRLRRHFAARHDLLAARPIARLHGDLQPDHVIVDARGERVIAFLDFADAQPGDPLWDIAVLTLWDDALVSPLLASYATIADNAATRELLTSYRLLRHVGAISWFLDRDFTALAARTIAAITTILRSED